MLTPTPAVDLIVSSLVDDQGEMISVRCTPHGFMGDVITLRYNRKRSAPIDQGQVSFEHSSMRDPQVSEITAAACFVEAYAFLIDLGKWVVDQRLAGTGVQRIEQLIQRMGSIDQKVA